MTQAPVAHLQFGGFSLALTSVSPARLLLLANQPLIPFLPIRPTGCHGLELPSHGDAQGHCLAFPGLLAPYQSI